MNAPSRTFSMDIQKPQLHAKIFLFAAGASPISNEKKRFASPPGSVIGGTQWRESWASPAETLLVTKISIII